MPSKESHGVELANNQLGCNLMCLNYHAMLLYFLYRVPDVIFYARSFVFLRRLNKVPHPSTESLRRRLWLGLSRSSFLGHCIHILSNVMAHHLVPRQAGIYSGGYAGCTSFVSSQGKFCLIKPGQCPI